MRFVKDITSSRKPLRAGPYTLMKCSKTKHGYSYTPISLYKTPAMSEYTKDALLNHRDVISMQHRVNPFVKLKPELLA